MQLKNFIKFTLPLLAISLSACDQQVIFKSKSYADIRINSNRGNSVETIDPSEYTLARTISNVEPYTLQNRALLPSSGNINLLIVPVILPGYEMVDINNDGQDDKDQVRTDILSTFFKENEKTGFKTVYDYYKQASFGALNLVGTITPWVDLSKNTQISKQNPNELAKDYTYTFVKEVVKSLTNLGYKMTNYDFNTDGYIDGIYIINTATSGTSSGDFDVASSLTSWANNSYYDSSETLAKADKSNPVPSCFAWSSFEKMYGSYENQVDSHEYIHEIGHMLGLNDYSSDTEGYSPLGKVDMMDEKTGDLNSYSKMLLGWSRPYYAIGSCTLRLNAATNKHNFIVIPKDTADMETESFDPYSEFILIDLYTNEANNEIDSNKVLLNKIPTPKTIGIRVYHINNTLYTLNNNEGSKSVSVYQNEELKEGMYFATPITNNTKEDIYNKEYGLSSSVATYDEIRLIEANGNDTFSTYGNLTSESLFDERDLFDIKNYKSFFENGYLDFGDAFTTTIEITAIYDKR